MNKNRINGRVLRLFAPIMMLLIVVLTLGVVLIVQSNTYAVVTYGGQETKSTETATSGAYFTMAYQKAVNFGIDNTSFNQTLRADAGVHVTTNSPTGYKLYITGADNKLKTSDGLHEIPYNNLTANQIQKSNLDRNSWGIFVKKGSQDYLIPLCTIATLSQSCLISENNGPVTNEHASVEFAAHVGTDLASGSYHSAPLVYSAVINTNSTAEFPIRSIKNTKVPLMPNGDTITNSSNHKLKHWFEIELPLLEFDQTMTRPDQNMYTITVGGVNCEILANSFVKNKDGVKFKCVSDFSTASPRFMPGQKTEVVVTTKPYGYIFSKQNAIEFVNGEATFNYTGTPQEMIFPMGASYRFELMGASGGDRTPAQAAQTWYGSNEVMMPGVGGYSSGIRSFGENEKLMVFVGGKGQSAHDRGAAPYDAKGGFNGGGNGASGLLVPGTSIYSWGGAGGGGSSDIRPYEIDDYVQFIHHRDKRTDGWRDPSNILLNDGPWANLPIGYYQAVIKTVNLPDADFEGVLAYYDLNYASLSDVYTQKFGDYILVYFNYTGTPAATHLEAGNTGPAIEIRLKVKTTNQAADITSMKFYNMINRLIVAGGGAGGSFIARGGHGGGSGGNPKYLGSLSDPNYSNFRFPEGGKAYRGGGLGFGASAPTHGAIYPRVSVEAAGRPGAGGGWFGGNAELSDYATSPVVGAGAGGGQGHTGLMGRPVSYAYGTSGKSMEPWNTFQPTDKNGIVRITVNDYTGAY